MLTFDEKLAIIESFPELSRKNVSLGRINFQFDESVSDKKNVVYHLHPNGNGFVYAGKVHGFEKDEKGLVNIRDFNEQELRALLSLSIAELSGKEIEANEDSEEANAGKPEKWVNKENASLTVVEEDELWTVYYGANLEESFGSYREVQEYMAEEGFSKR